MRIVFRVDASIQIGSGHLIRCLTLATELSKAGATVEFISRAHPGNLNTLITSRGFRLRELPQPVSTEAELSSVDDLYFQWLGVSQQEDADQTLAVIGADKPEWLIVDHYGLDSSWEERLLPNVDNMLALDDMANRPHACQVLLDQNFGATKQKYQKQIGPNCTVLAGANYALLRGEFVQYRDISLRRRNGNDQVRTILISMGGVDADNYTGRIVDQLARMQLAEDLELVFILGATSPNIESVRQSVATLRFSAAVKVSVCNVAELMADADLAIGAAGVPAGH